MRFLYGFMLLTMLASCGTVKPEPEYQDRVPPTVELTMINGANMVTDVYKSGFVTFHSKSWDNIASKSLSIHLQKDDSTQVMFSQNCVDPEPQCREMVILSAAQPISKLADGLYTAYAVAEDRAGNISTSKKITFEVFQAQPIYVLKDQSDFQKNTVRLTLQRQQDSLLHPYDFLRIFRNGNIIKSVPLNQPFESYIFQDDVSQFQNGPLVYDFALSYGADDLFFINQMVQLYRNVVVFDYNISDWSGNALIRFLIQSYDSDIVEARLYRDNLLVDTYFYGESDKLTKHSNLTDYPAPKTGIHQYTVQTINSKGDTFTTLPLNIDVSKPHTFE